MDKIKREEDLPARIVKRVTGCGNSYIAVSIQGGKPFEVFANLGKSGGCVKCQTEAITRLVTLVLRYGIPKEEVIDQLIGLECQNSVRFPQGKEALSCPDAIARVLKLVGDSLEEKKETKMDELADRIVDKLKGDEKNAANS